MKPWNPLFTTASSRFVGVLTACLLTAAAQGAVTPLADEPLVTSNASTVPPNILFALDDSGSMDSDYLPDWAGPLVDYVDGKPVQKPVYQFYNAAFNGIAYNPATRYSPPVMYDSSGTRDFNAYPSMTGESVNTGGSTSASATSRNWREVPDDAYGIQTTAKRNLEGRAFYYRTVVGEYCAAKNLRQCIDSTEPKTVGGVAYTHPAPLRWCATAAYATGTTADANPGSDNKTHCQATRIDATGTAVGYTFPRFAQPYETGLTVSVVGKVDNITVDGQKIMAYAIESAVDANDLANKIVTQINACTLAKIGACEVVGHVARLTPTAGQVAFYTPGKPTELKPVVSVPGSDAASFSNIYNFTKGNVPGVVLRQIISPDTASYPKAADRIDCAGTTCTYAEEMSNYANWWAYYRTRMQMMKTAASRAFLGVNDKFRVGYFSINNGTGSDFLGVDAFKEAHRHNWYAKFFAAKPLGPTPLRTGLATAGRYYAGQLESVNGQDAIDPMQYSCQKNYTILSTDGYWNDNSNPKRIDGRTDIGNQDNNDPRPYYDGGTWKQITSQTAQTELQLGVTKKQNLQDAWQLKSLTERITQVTTTTTTYPWTLESWQLQKQDTPLIKKVFNLEQRVYPLQAEITPLEERTVLVDQRVRRLVKSVPNYSEVFYKPNQDVTLVKSQSWPLEKIEKLLTQNTYALQQATLKMRSREAKLQRREDTPRYTLYPLQQSTYQITQSTFDLQKFTHTLKKTTSQLVRTRMESNNGGDRWYQVIADADTCQVGDSQLSGQYQYKETTCSYREKSVDSGQTSCTKVNPSPGPSYTVANPVACVYEHPTTPSATGSAAAPCVAGSPSTGQNFSSYDTCQFSTKSETVTLATNQSCTAKYASATSGTNLSGTTEGNKVVCAHSGTPTATTPVARCTATTVAENNAYTKPKITCGYSGTASETNKDTTSCTNYDQSGTAAGTEWSGDKKVCSWKTGDWAFVTNGCTQSGSADDYTKNKVVCQFGNTLGTAAMGNWGGYVLTACSPENTPASGIGGTPSNVASATGSRRVDCEAQPFSELVEADWSAASSCTATPVPTNFTSTGLACRYSPNAVSSNPPSCKPNAGVVTPGVQLSGTTSGDKKSCFFSGGTWTAVTPAATGTCKPNKPVAAGDGTLTGNEIACRYSSTSSTLRNQDTCSPNDVGAAVGSELPAGTRTGPRTVCSWEGSTQRTSVDTCTYDDPGATNPIRKRVICSYPDSPTSTGATNLYRCPTDLKPRSNYTGGTTPGSKWETAKECATGRPTEVGAEECLVNGDLTAEPPYTSCGYEWPGTLTEGLESCIVDAPKRDAANPNKLIGGSITECTYQRLANNTDDLYTPKTESSPGVLLEICTPVPKSTNAKQLPSGTPNSAGIFQTSAQDGKTVGKAISCHHLTSGKFTLPPTGSTEPLASCTNKAAMATNGVDFQKQVVCRYANSVDHALQNLDAARCEPYDESAKTGDGQTWTGPRITCNYSTINTGNANASSCEPKPRSKVSPFTGPEVLCSYGTAGGWKDVKTGECVTQAKSQAGAATFVGPARECRYDRNPDQGADNTCTNLAQSPASPYTVTLAKNCVQKEFERDPVPSTKTVDNCSTLPTDTTSATGVRTQTATTCTFASVVTGNSNSCTCQTGAAPEIGSGSACYSSGGVLNYAASGTNPAYDVYTTQVHCRSDRINDKTPVANCTPAGSAPGSYAAGKIVQCTVKDLTPTGATPVASCTVGQTTMDASFVYSTCTEIMKKGPFFVETCTDTPPSASNNFVGITCDRRMEGISLDSASSCIAQTAKEPDWKTVTCVANGDGTINSLADVAAYYYKTDLRTFALRNCTGANGAVLCTATNEMNDVQDEKNKAQHMVTYTLGLGASGYMQYSSSYDTDTAEPYLADPSKPNNAPGDFPMVRGKCGAKECPATDGIPANPARGACSWQSVGNCDWPAPVKDQQTTIDDLWHAAVNGRGLYFSATNPDSLANSIAKALGDVEAKNSYGAGAAVSNTQLLPSDSYVFGNSYKSFDWTGDVTRITLDPWTGQPAATADWSAQTKLDAKPWADRAIYTFDSGAASKLKEFTAANFGTAAMFKSPRIDDLSQFACGVPEVCLQDADKTKAAGAKLVDFLRGDRSNEGAKNDNSKYFRQRAHVLGDIVNAKTVYVKAPFRNYAEKGYAKFKEDQENRRGMVYAAANDGMLHAFNATGSDTTEYLTKDAAIKQLAATLDPSDATKAAAAATAIAAAKTALDGDTEIGQEKWAYIPSMVLPKMYRLADKNYERLHRYLVDATPVTGDICSANCNAETAVWKTILVGGLGKGGRGYYALDITDPAAPKALWEFTHADLGYTYGEPQIGKLKNGTWVVMFASGYNNVDGVDGVSGGSGVGKLFVLNAVTGAQITGSPISTGVGSATDPSGLAQITAPSSDPMQDPVVLGVYGGDLFGNLWRFDLNDEVGPSGIEAQLLAKLKDKDGKAQAITTRPLVSKVQDQYIVLVTTGRYLSIDDNDIDEKHSVYGLIDRRESGTTASTAIYDNPRASAAADSDSNGFIVQEMEEVACPSDSPSYLCQSGEMVTRIKKNSIKPNYEVHNGWVIDLIHDEERGNLNPVLAMGTMVINTNAPTDNPCDSGGKSYQYWLDYESGGAVAADTPDNPGGLLGIKIADFLVGAPSVVVAGDGRVLSFTQGVGLRPIPISKPLISRRTSWREVVDE